MSSTDKHTQTATRGTRTHACARHLGGVYDYSCRREGPCGQSLGSEIRDWALRSSTSGWGAGVETGPFWGASSCFGRLFFATDVSLSLHSSRVKSEPQLHASCASKPTFFVAQPQRSSLLKHSGEVACARWKPFSAGVRCEGFDERKRSRNVAKGFTFAFHHDKTEYFLAFGPRSCGPNFNFCKINSLPNRYPGGLRDVIEVADIVFSLLREPCSMCLQMSTSTCWVCTYTSGRSAPPVVIDGGCNPRGAKQRENSTCSVFSSGVNLRFGQKEHALLAHLGSRRRIRAARL